MATVACVIIKITNYSMNEVNLLKVNIFWFRRDLRINDNKAFINCILEGRAVLPIYIIEYDILKPPIFTEPRTQFLLGALKGLNDEMRQFHSKLYVFRGEPLHLFHEISNHIDVEKLFFNRNYEPSEIERDRKIWDFCKTKGIKLKTFKDQVLHERGEILKKDKTPYSVFTFYYKKWKLLKKENCEETPPFKTIDFSVLKDYSLPNPTEFEKMNPKEEYELFLEDKIFNYEENRDFPYLEGTSRISAYLRTGALSIRQVYHSAEYLLETNEEKKLKSIETFIKQLCWRDFYYQILYHFPYVETGAFIEKFNQLKWENNANHFQRWCEGKTGFPIVDAGMRQLNQEGWMHNRLRMITASFLTKDLLIDWRWGERYFKERLIDYDLPLNNGGWQWCASTGTDAQPYFRIFNPATQSKKFDPKGVFIRKYIPELRQVNEKHIHQPTDMSENEQKDADCVIGQDYPYPIVDHTQQRKRTLEMYKHL